MYLLDVRTSKGRNSVCDEKCYNATMPACHCVCGGRNHGVGLNQAVKNTLAMLDSEIKLNAKTYPSETVLVVVKNPYVQLEMFTCPPQKP